MNSSQRQLNYGVASLTFHLLRMRSLTFATTLDRSASPYGVASTVAAAATLLICLTLGTQSAPTSTMGAASDAAHGGILAIGRVLRLEYPSLRVLSADGSTVHIYVQERVPGIARAPAARGAMSTWSAGPPTAIVRYALEAQLLREMTAEAIGSRPS